MIVIVPHQDIELKLIKAQKNLIAQFADNNDNIVYPAMPLWINTDFTSVEDAKKQIKKITVHNPEFDDVEKALVCPVEIETMNGIIKNKLNFISGLLRFARNDKMSHDDKGCNIFPLDVKIFRLGEATSSKPGVYELSSTVWKKLS